MRSRSGAGCLLLAAASAMAQVGRDPRRHGLFWATDVDPLCADMVLIQLSLRGLPALVAKGDSLRPSCVRVMPTPA